MTLCQSLEFTGVLLTGKTMASLQQIFITGEKVTEDLVPNF